MLSWAIFSPDAYLADAPSARPGDLLRVKIDWPGAFSWVGKAAASEGAQQG